jgi:hypothetical protein
MNNLAFAVSFACIASALPACKKEMPPAVAARWPAIEDLARSAGPICDRALALPECPLKSDGLVHPEAGTEASLPASSLTSAVEVREVEVYCKTKGQAKEEFTHSCYLSRHVDAKGPQIAARWACGGNKPYPGWEHSKDGLSFSVGRNCQEKLHNVAILRTSPAGNTVQATVYFYVDGHAPPVAPAPQ